MDPTHYQKLKAKALKVLAQREHSRYELQQKLAKNSEDSALIEHILNECEQENWLNEARFVQAYLQYRAQKQYGPKKIRYELQQRGVSAEQIEHALSACNLDWTALAETARQRKFGKAPPQTWTERGKQNQYLYQRGF